MQKCALQVHELTIILMQKCALQVHEHTIILMQILSALQEHNKCTSTAQEVYCV